MNEEFIKELDAIVLKDYNQIIDDMKEWKTKICGFSFLADMDLETKIKYGLNEDIEFMINVSPDGGKTEYLYKSMVVSPDCYYIRPDDYHEVPVLTMLQEAIKQDRYNPDIKHLERGEEWE